MDFLGQHSHLVVTEALDRAPILDGILAYKDVWHSAASAAPSKQGRLLGVGLAYAAVRVIVIVQLQRG